MRLGRLVELEKALFGDKSYFRCLEAASKVPPADGSEYSESDNDSEVKSLIDMTSDEDTPIRSDTEIKNAMDKCSGFFDYVSSEEWVDNIRSSVNPLCNQNAGYQIISRELLVKFYTRVDPSQCCIN
ncbi:hypothetical protein EDC01DRAFT_626135 [Geopyxis carbonaria]|nr:hypothetical protein EDC01DRAFT_626135 [Geopyxis carbonaria]